MKQFMHNSHMFVARLETVQVIQIQSFSRKSDVEMSNR